MAQVAVSIADDVADVLRRAITDGNAVRLPGDQLDRKLYQATDKVLQALGGKWNGKARAHVFSNDPAEKLAAALGEGRAIDELLTRKKTLQFFETPADLAARLVAKLGDITEDVCLEPSAGRGRIVKALSDAGAMSITAIEIDRDNAQAVLDQRLAVPVICANFLEQSPRAHVVAMNPPFTGNQDIRHVRHAFDCLMPYGRLAAIVGEHGFIGQEREAVEWRAWLADVVATVEIIPAGAFKESGTSIQTRMIFIRKPTQ